ncbi:DUF368 domain-containing protein [Lacrimispora amygdalina]|uniref:DUF368 domain-containing protein n=1 Tax=Lacrimispora amygdalina TaxID=253257 RepID=A0ABQ5M0P5_9FIRM|nr:DUF368 domain-containing protein [Haloimpatiens lingqiaonensis]
MIRQFINGVCMAMADSVPGVSGGTIAFILGFYDKFIGSINDLIYEKGDKRKQAFLFLIKLGVGWVFGMIAAVLVLSSAFESQIYFVSSLFMGFIIASIPLVLKQEKESFIGHYGNVVAAVIGAAVVCLITMLNQSSFMTGIQLDSLSIPLAIYIFIAGMIAISAMFLPGISGSTLLLIFGLYMPVITGIKEFLHLNLSVFPGLCIFGLGVIAGALSVVKGIKICLDRFRSKTMYMILGLMIGSLYAIMMGPTTLDVPKDALSFHNFSFIAFIIGIAIVAGLQFMGKKKEVAFNE